MKLNSLIAIISLVSAFSLQAASTFKYDCKADSRNHIGLDYDLQVAVNSKTMKVSNDSVGLKTSGSFDKDYKPQSANLNKIRYEGFDEIAGGESYLIRILIEKDMLKGAEKGVLKVQATGEGYSSGIYYFSLK